MSGRREVPDDAQAPGRHAFWPGPLTLVVRAPTRVSRRGDGRVATPSACACPDQPVALALLRAFGGGIAAPSANRFGRVSPTSAAAVARGPGRRRRSRPRRWAVRGWRRVDHRRLLRGRRPRSCVSAASPRTMLESPARTSPVGTGGPTAAPGTLVAHYAPRAAGRDSFRPPPSPTRAAEAGAGGGSRRCARPRWRCRGSGRAPGVVILGHAGRCRRVCARCSTPRSERPTRSGSTLVLVVATPAAGARCRGRRPAAARVEPIASPDEPGPLHATDRSACSTPGSVVSRCCASLIDLLPGEPRVLR